jgi:hypothetical protein
MGVFWYSIVRHAIRVYPKNANPVATSRALHLHVGYADGFFMRTADRIRIDCWMLKVL